MITKMITTNVGNSNSFGSLYVNSNVENYILNPLFNGFLIGSICSLRDECWIVESVATPDGSPCYEYDKRCTIVYDFFSNKFESPEIGSKVVPTHGPPNTTDEVLLALARLSEGKGVAWDLILDSALHLP